MVHAPFVKSGMATGCPPMAMDSSDRAVIHIQEAASYTSMGQGFFSMTLLKNALNTSQSMPPWFLWYIWLLVISNYTMDYGPFVVRFLFLEHKNGAAAP